jgi:hypothetical protein
MVSTTTIIANNLPAVIAAGNDSNGYNLDSDILYFHSRMMPDVDPRLCGGIMASYVDACAHSWQSGN